MAIEIFNQTIRPIMEVDITDGVSVTYSNGAKMDIARGIWSYERDGKSSTSRDPQYAVIGAEQIGRGKAIFEGSGFTTRIVKDRWSDYDRAEPRYEKIKRLRRGVE